MGMIDAKRPELGEMPVWDLNQMFPGFDSPAFKAELADVQQAAKEFAVAWRGRISTLSAPEFTKSLKDYEALTGRTIQVAGYALHNQSLAGEDPVVGRHYQMVNEVLSALSADVLFFRLEINALDESELASMLRDPALSFYGPWLHNLRAGRIHDLPEAEERLLTEKSVAGAQAWVRLFDETQAHLRYDFMGERLTISEVRHHLEDADRTKREAAARAIHTTLGDNLRLFAHITNTLAKDKEIEDRWRKFDTPQASRHLANLIEPEVVKALVSAVEAAMPRLSHRYFKLKAKWLGLAALKPWDAFAPLPQASEPVIPWAEAARIVADVYNGFSPELGKLVPDFFNEGRVDAPVRPGKYAGAYSNGTMNKPYLLVNYMGKTDDVMTLAHEMGHGLHDVLARRTQGHLLTETPLTLAETASVFGEMLTFRYMLARVTNVSQKKMLLARKIEGMIGTVIRQIAYYQFESRVHEGRRMGELLPEQLDAHWAEVQQAAFGPAMDYDAVAHHNWAYIPHFIHTPFYVYAYAFGDCLTNALYANYQAKPEGFAEKYMTLLSSGGRYRHKELLAPFGLDATDPAFWQSGLTVLEQLIDELEGLEQAA